MSPEQMFSLFAGFAAASFLIWLTAYLERGARSTKGKHLPMEHNSHPHHNNEHHHSHIPGRRPGERAGARIHEGAWNVSTFFGLQR